MAAEGNWAMATEMSSATVQSRQACSKASRSIVSPGVRNRSRFKDASVAPVSLRNRYSEQEFEARISSVDGQVCQSLIVVA